MLVLNIIITIVAILLVISILLQQRGSGLGSAFGGEGNVYMAKRGAEKVIFVVTIILAFIFLALGVIRLIV